MPRSFFALVTVPALLISSPALASSPCAVDCNFVTEPSQCTVGVSGGCTGMCEPINLVAECDGSCNVSAEADCTDTCETACESKCTETPGSVTCSGYCEQDCDASCASSCSDSDCQTDCEADCSNRCGVQCTTIAPTVSCTDQCKTACSGSCTVQANIDCHAKCVVSAQGGCQVACQDPGLVIFCGDQYVDSSEAASCVSCLETNGFSLSVDTTCSGTTCTTTAGVCSASPTVSASRDGWGVFGIAAAVMGLGLASSRRRRSA